MYVNDGDTTVIDNLTIEWDSGLTIVAPTGQAIQPGEQITVTDGVDNTAILQFVDDVLTLSDIIATDGSALIDGDTFQIDDETKSVNAYHNLSHHGNVPEKVKQLEQETISKENVTMEEAAAHFGYTVQSVRNLYLSFMNDEVNFFPEISTGPKQPRIQPLIIYKIIALRKDYGLSVDFHQTKFI